MLQPQEMDISDIGFVHTPVDFQIPPMSKMHASDKTKQTNYIQWEHLLATSVGSGADPIT